MGEARLPLTQPAFRAEMFEKGMQPIGPVVFTLRDREAARDLGLPSRFIGKARSAVRGLNECPGKRVLEEYFGRA